MEILHFFSPQVSHGWFKTEPKPEFKWNFLNFSPSRKAKLWFYKSLQQEEVVEFGKTNFSMLFPPSWSQVLREQ